MKSEVVQWLIAALGCLQSHVGQVRPLDRHLSKVAKKGQGEESGHGHVGFTVTTNMAGGSVPKKPPWAGGAS